MRTRIDNLCRARYWDITTKQKLHCVELKYYKHDICQRCEERKEESRIRRRYFPYKYNNNVVLDITL